MKEDDVREAEFLKRMEKKQAFMRTPRYNKSTEQAQNRTGEASVLGSSRARVPQCYGELSLTGSILLGLSTIKGTKGDQGVIPFGVSPAVVEFSDYTVPHDPNPNPTISLLRCSPNNLPHTHQLLTCPPQNTDRRSLLRGRGGDELGADGVSITVEGAHARGVLCDSSPIPSVRDGNLGPWDVMPL